MGCIVQFGWRIFLLHLVLNQYGSGEATREVKPAENGGVLKLPSMENAMNHRNHGMMDHLDPSWLVFFTLNDLKQGNRLPVYFPNKKSSPLLSENEANSIPFSYSHLPYLLHLFSFSPDSPQAKSMESTLKQCETKPIKGETKVCATSIESVLDFVHESFGLETQFQVLQTIFIKKPSMSVDNYTIMSEPIEVRVRNMIACHSVPYPYRVFYCHCQKSENKLFKVSLGGENGGKVEAIAVCHMDTSQWSRDHASFRVLGIEPGSSHVCHFFRKDVFVYVPVVKIDS